MLLLIPMDSGNIANLVAPLMEIPPHTWILAGRLGLSRNLAEWPPGIA